MAGRSARRSTRSRVPLCSPRRYPPRRLKASPPTRSQRRLALKGRKARESWSDSSLPSFSPSPWELQSCCLGAGPGPPGSALETLTLRVLPLRRPSLRARGVGLAVVAGRSSAVIAAAVVAAAVVAGVAVVAVATVVAVTAVVGVRVAAVLARVLARVFSGVLAG